MCLYRDYRTINYYLNYLNTNDNVINIIGEIIIDKIIKERTKVVGCKYNKDKDNVVCGDKIILTISKQHAYLKAVYRKEKGKADVTEL